MTKMDLQLIKNVDCFVDVYGKDSIDLPTSEKKYLIA